MAIVQRPITYYRYRIKCDRCGASAPEGGNEDQAIALAEDLGWQHSSIWDGQNDYRSKDTCPNCLEELEVLRMETGEE